MFTKVFFFFVTCFLRTLCVSIHKNLVISCVKRRYNVGCSLQKSFSSGRLKYSAGMVMNAQTVTKFCHFNNKRKRVWYFVYIIITVIIEYLLRWYLQRYYMHITFFFIYYMTTSWPFWIASKSVEVTFVIWSIRKIRRLSCGGREYANVNSRDKKCQYMCVYTRIDPAK